MSFDSSKGQCHRHLNPSPTPAMKEEISKNEPDEMIVYKTLTGEKYHNIGCRYLSQSSIKIILQDAKREGLTPCKVCKPPQ